MHNEAKNGMEALEILKTDRYSLLFMDARMPGIDGIKATQFIRNEMNIKDSEMPIICISAASLNEDWQKYQKAGMNAYLPKPFTEELLLTTILSVIKDYVPLSTGQPVIDNSISSEEPDKINLQNLYHISGGDEQFVKQMLTSFIDSTKKGLDDMLDAVKSGEPGPVAELAHKLLPPARHIGASELCRLLKNIEENVQARADVQAIQKIVVESLCEFDIVSGLINKHISKIG
jgi:CheY-like chemotaxis protein/HPt (histidine-containing phosphotransfer) domain-containing protein